MTGLDQRIYTKIENPICPIVIATYRSLDYHLISAKRQKLNVFKTIPAVKRLISL